MANGDRLEHLSDTLADRLAEISYVVAIRIGQRGCSGVLWRDDVVVTSDRALPQGADFTVLRHGVSFPASLAGSDGSTGIAVLRLARGVGRLPPEPAPPPRVGALVLVAGADDRGAATGRLAMVHAAGAEGSDRLDCRLEADAGGAVLTLGGGLLGVAGRGPRRRATVIPCDVIERVLDPLLARGSLPRGWLGVGLQRVPIPEEMRDEAEYRRGLQVMALVPGAPAEAAGVVAGDIVLAVDDVRVGGRPGLAGALNEASIGRTATLTLLRDGAVRRVAVVIGRHPTRG